MLPDERTDIIEDKIVHGRLARHVLQVAFATLCREEYIKIIISVKLTIPCIYDGGESFGKLYTHIVGTYGR